MSGLVVTFSGSCLELLAWIGVLVFWAGMSFWAGLIFRDFRDDEGNES